MASTVPTLKLDIGRSAGWMFKSPNWMVNLLWLALCALLGSVVVGTLVAYGYQFEVIQKRLRGRTDVVPDFDPNRILDYLVRGAWPYLIQMILTFVVVLCTLPVLIVMFVVCLVPIQGQADPSPLAVLGIIGGMLLWSMLFVAAMFFVSPLIFRAGLSGDFSEGFRFAWALDFVKRMWPTLLFAVLAVFGLSLVAQFVGMLLCLIGVIFTSSWLQLAMADMASQLYDIYLQKGGQPIPLQASLMEAEVL